MTDLAEDDATDAGDSGDRTYAASFYGAIAAAVVAGAILGITARLGAVDLLVGIAVVQAVVTLSVGYGFAVPGRRGVVVLGALAAGGADAVVSVWPHSRLGTLLAVLGLAIPVLIAQQLSRGAARARVLESLGGAALIVIAVVALPAYLQLRHEIVGTTTAGRVVFAAVLSIVAALVVGYLADLVVPLPRFDAAVPRGLIAVVASAGVAALVGYLTLRDTPGFDGGGGLFAGGSLGVLAALVSVGVAFGEATAAPAGSTFARRLRPVLAAVVPICVLAPVAFLLCLAIRT